MTTKQIVSLIGVISCYVVIGVMAYKNYKEEKKFQEETSKVIRIRNQMNDIERKMKAIGIEPNK